MLKLAHIPYILAYHVQIDADPDPVSDPSYHFDADPDLDFYLMWMRIRSGIQVTKMMRIPADPDPQHWLLSRPHMQMF